MNTRLSDMVNREKKDLAQIVTWRGLNKTDGATDGFLSDCTNLTADNYPTLSPRKGRTVAATLTNPTALYSWDKLVYVDDGVLYYDGSPACNVTSEPKQFAVVNTKLVVWPDKLMVDLTNSSVSRMDATVTNNGNATITANSITLVPRTSYSTFDLTYRNEHYDTDPRDPWIWVYDSVSWNGSTWTLTNPQRVNLFVGSIDGKIYIPSATYNSHLDEYSLGHPTCVWSENEPTDFVEPAPGNNLGFYVVMKFFEAQGGPSYRVYKYHCTAYNASEENNQDLTTIFHVGDAVTISGTTYGLADAEHQFVSAVTSNSLTFGGNLPLPVWYYVFNADTTIGNKTAARWTDDGTTYYADLTEGWEFTEGNLLLYMYDGSNYTFVEWNPDENVAVHTYPASAPSTQAHYMYTFYAVTLYASTETAHFTVTVDIPSFDYICAWNNRLWGVVNNELNRVWNKEKEEWEESYSRVIYGSALGQPWQFYDYSGLSTDSYAVVVGSKGDFTGVCAYSRSLLAWKENMLYRISGDAPSDYVLYDYNVAGVKQGCHKSLRIINEVLYYKGRDGFYAYTGATPQLISYVLGENDGIARATATERKYYAAMDYGDEGEILVYDTLTNTWYREDDTLAADMTYCNGNVYFLKDNKLYIADDDESTEDVEWSATFVRANETFHERKDYKWIRIRADMATDSTIKAEVSIDRGAFVTILPTTTVSGLKMFEIPMQNNRVDELVLRLSGKGAGKIRSVIREFHEGSAYCK